MNLPSSMIASFFLAAVAAPRPSSAEPPPLLDVLAVPLLDAAGQAAYARWTLSSLPRAFANYPKGKHGTVGACCGEG